MTTRPGLIIGVCVFLLASCGPPPAAPPAELSRVVVDLRLGAETTFTMRTDGVGCARLWRREEQPDGALRLSLVVSAHPTRCDAVVTTDAR